MNHFTACIGITSDKPDLNGHIWPKDELQKAVNDFNSRVPVVCAMNNTPVTGTNASHIITNMQIKNDGIVYAEIQILDSLPEGKKLKNLLSCDLHLSVGFSAVGVINEQNNVQNVTFNSMNFNIDQNNLDQILFTNYSDK